MIHGVVRAFEDVGEDQIRFAVVDGDSAGDRNLGIRPGVSVVSVDFFLQFFKEFRIMVEVAFFQNEMCIRDMFAAAGRRLCCPCTSDILLCAVPAPY